jgi:hypothetical protein
LDILSASGVSCDSVIFIFSARFRSRPDSRPYSNVQGNLK